MADDLQKDVIKAAMELMLEKVEEAISSGSFWTRFRVAPIAKNFGATLDNLVRDLRPCFVLGEPTSLQQMFYELTLPTRSQSWDRVHDVLNVVGAWFRAWDRLNQGIGARRSPKVLIEQIRSLYDLLMYTGLILPEARKPTATIAQDSPAYIIYKATADRYNTFLTNFEGLLRRLPTEVGILDDPIVGKEHFFIRL
jgi:hypothetical protein